MKNYLTLVLALSVLSSPAFASTARLEALGESTNGSLYLDDIRNIFINPAQIVHYKKKLELEMGNDYTSTPNSVANPHPQGGFTNTFGDYTYGIYLNNNSDRTQRIVGAANKILQGLQTTPALQGGAGLASATNAFVAPDSTIEAFFAGESAVNWGVSVFYTGNNSQGTATTGPTDNHSLNLSTSHLLGARLGVEAGMLQVFGLVGISENAKIADAFNDEIKGHFSWDLGASYKMDNWTVFARTQQYGADVDIAIPQLGSVGTTEDRNHLYTLGLGYKKDVTKSINLFTRLEADYFKGSNNGGVAAAVHQDQTDIQWNVPLVMAAEAQATSWLAVRASIAQSLVGQEMFGSVRNNLQGTTTVAAGLGLTFGDLQIDGLLATSNDPNPAVTGSGTGSGQPVFGFGTAPQSNGTLGTNFLSRIALTYNF